MNSFRLAILAALFALSGCSAFSPTVEGFKKARLLPEPETNSSEAEIEKPDPTTTGDGTDPLLALHVPKPGTCANCHEAKRPAANHYAGKDCAMCHNYPSFKDGAGFTHVLPITNCEECHTRPTTVGLRAYPNQGPPANFDPNNATTPGSGHYRGKDCVSCHQPQSETVKTFTFSHSKPAPGVCLPCHYNDGFGEHGANDGRATYVQLGNCFNCHQNFDRAVDRNWDRP